VTILDLEDFEIGRVVISKKGKDKGTFYVIIGKDALNNRVYVADGKHRSITRPKPKNPKHLQATNWYLRELKERLEDNREISDEWIHQQLLVYYEKKGFN